VFLAGLELDRGSIARFLNFCLELCMRVLIVSRHGLYVKDAVFAALSPPGL